MNPGINVSSIPSAMGRWTIYIIASTSILERMANNSIGIYVTEVTEKIRKAGSHVQLLEKMSKNL